MSKAAFSRIDREFLNLFRQGVSIFDENLDLVACNSEYLTLLGFPEKLGVPGTGISDMFRFNAERGDYGNDKSVEEMVEERMVLARQNQPHTLERTRPDGRVFLIQGTPIEGGGFLSTHSDITELRKTQDLLRRDKEYLEEQVRLRTVELEKKEREQAERKAQLQVTVESVENGISLFDRDLNLVVCNSKFIELLDFPKEFGEPGTPFRRLVEYNYARGEYGDGDKESLINAMIERTRKFEAHHFHRTRPDGTILEIVGKPIEQGFVTTYRDVTEETISRNNLQQEFDANAEELARTYDLLKNVLDTIPVRVFWKDTESRYLGANKLFLEDAGRGTAVDIYHKTDFELPWADRADALRQDDVEIIRDKVKLMNVEQKLIAPDGSDFWLRRHKVPMLSPEGDVIGVLGTFEDITELKTQELALKESEERYKPALQGVNDGIFDWRITEKTIFLSNRATALLDLPSDKTEFADNVIYDQLNAHDQKLFRSEVVRHLKGETEYFECEFSIVSVENVESWVLCRGLALRDETGRSYRMSGSLSNITRRKKVERELQELNETLEQRVRLRTEELEAANKEILQTITVLKDTQDELIQSEKLASLGSLVSGIAHEVNTPIGIGVTAASHLFDAVQKLEASFKEGSLKKSSLEAFFDQAREGTQMVLSNLDRAAKLVGSFKQVAVDRTHDDYREIELTSYLEEVLTSLYPQLKSTNINIQLDAQGPGLKLMTDPGALAQIVTNLIMNSLTHAFDHGEEGEISLTCRAMDSGVEIIYRDNGKGMDEAVVNKIFEPFFTTRRGEGGSGLGMNIVYNLVTQKMHGKIRCSSAPGKGAEFILTIPQFAG